MIDTSTTESEMKNINTPRTLADCEFTTGYSGIRRETGYSTGWWTAMCACTIAAVVVIVMVGVPT